MIILILGVRMGIYLIDFNVCFFFIIFGILVVERGRLIFIGIYLRGRIGRLKGERSE